MRGLMTLHVACQKMLGLCPIMNIRSLLNLFINKRYHYFVADFSELYLNNKVINSLSSCCENIRELLILFYTVKQFIFFNLFRSYNQFSLSRSRSAVRVKNRLTAKVLGSDLPVYPIDVHNSNHLRKSNDEERN